MTHHVPREIHEAYLAAMSRLTEAQAAANKWVGTEPLTDTSGGLEVTEETREAFRELEAATKAHEEALDAFMEHLGLGAP